MKDFTQTLAERIDKSKSRIIEAQEEQSKELMQTFKASQKHLKEALIKDTKKLRKDMSLKEQELESDIERYKLYNQEQIQEEQSKGNSRYNIIIAMQIILLAALLFPAVKNWNEKRIANEWKVPQKHQYTSEKGNKFIIIQVDEIQLSQDKETYYIEIDQGE